MTQANAATTTVNPVEVFEDLYDSEIHFDISVEWDDGFHWAVHTSGFDAVEGSARTVAKLAEAMGEVAVRYFPGSPFAVKYCRLLHWQRPIIEPKDHTWRRSRDPAKDAAFFGIAEDRLPMSLAEDELEGEPCAA